MTTPRAAEPCPRCGAFAPADEDPVTLEVVVRAHRPLSPDCDGSPASRGAASDLACARTYLVPALGLYAPELGEGNTPRGVLNAAIRLTLTGMSAQERESLAKRACAVARAASTRGRVSDYADAMCAVALGTTEIRAVAARLAQREWLARLAA